MADQVIATHRRYLYLKYAYNARLGEDDRATVWDAKRRLVPGTTIPVSFPARTALLAAGFLVLEEIEGADETELTTAGLSTLQAAAVVAALE